MNVKTENKPISRKDSFKAWEDVFQSQEWGKYPPEELIRFIAKNYYKSNNRDAVKILDIGCGTGACTWYLSREGFSAYGIDGSVSAIKRGKKRFAAEALSGEFIVGDIAKIPYVAESFDCVIDICSIQHNESVFAQKIVQECYRVLKKDGLFFSMLASYGSWTEPFEGKGYLKFYKINDVNQLFKNFSILSSETSERTYCNRTKKIKHWVVNVKKTLPHDFKID